MYPLHLLRFTLIFLLLPIGSALFAQYGGKWDIVWEKAPDPTLEVPSFIEHNGPGRYLLGTDASIYVTSDGGVTWDSVYGTGVTAYGLSTIETGSFVNDNTYIIVLDSTVTTRLSDTSWSWHYESRVLIISREDLRVKSIPLDSASNVHNITMLNETDGFFIAQLIGRDSNLLYHTEDGWKSWTTLPFPDVSVQAAQSMFSASHWVVHTYDPEDSTSYFYRTRDGGLSWQRSDVETPQVWVYAFPDELEWYGVGWTQDPSVGVIKQIVRTVDGGSSWSVLAESVFGTRWDRLRCVDFASSDVGVAGGADAIFRTSDGGENWSVESPPYKFLQLNTSYTDVAYPTADEAMMIGRNGVIAYRGDSHLVAPRIVSPADSFKDLATELPITWYPVSGAEWYEIEIGDTAYAVQSIGPRILDDPFISRRDIIDTTFTAELEEGVRYVMRIRAANSLGPGAWTAPVYFTTGGFVQTLAAPAFTYPLYFTSEVPIDTIFSWTEVENAVGYDLTVSHRPDHLINPVKFDHVPQGEARVSSLQPNTQYYASVRGRDANGVTSSWNHITFFTAAISSVRQDKSTRFALDANVVDDFLSLRTPRPLGEKFELSIVDMEGRNQPIEMRGNRDGITIDCRELTMGHYLLVIQEQENLFSIPFKVVR